MRTGFVFGWAGMLFLLLASSCGTMEKAAAKDPMRCERDPNCAAARSHNRDCATQCAYDPACIDRCREIQADGLGHR